MPSYDASTDSSWMRSSLHHLMKDDDDDGGEVSDECCCARSRVFWSVRRNTEKVSDVLSIELIELNIFKWIENWWSLCSAMDDSLAFVCNWIYQMILWTLTLLRECAAFLSILWISNVQFRFHAKAWPYKCYYQIGYFILFRTPCHRLPNLIFNCPSRSVQSSWNRKNKLIIVLLQPMVYSTQEELVEV